MTWGTLYKFCCWPSWFLLKFPTYLQQLFTNHSQPGPSGIKIFNPRIFRDGIPGFFGTGFTLIFNPGIVQKFLRDFSGFLFLLRVLVKSHHFHQSLSLSFSPPHPQEVSTMSAQHMKRLSQMLPQILTNWIGGRTTRKHFLFLLFWSGLSLQSQCRGKQ